MQENVEKYLEDLCDNTTIKRAENNSLILSVYEKKIRCKYDIKKMFDEYIGIEEPNMTRQDIEYFLGNYINMFRKKHGGFEEENFEYIEFYIECKIDDFIDFREHVVDNMLEHIEYYIEDGPWFELLESYLDLSKSKSDIRIDFIKYLKDKIIPMIIIDEIDSWWIFWSEIY